MTDRELIQAAANAAGLKGYIYEWIQGPAFIAPADPNVPRSGPVTYDWLNDDGDALRLAVELHIRIAVNRAVGLNVPGSVTVEYPDADGFYFALGEAVTQGDPYAATRRAVVRAAAEISRSEAGGNTGG